MSVRATPAVDQHGRIEQVPVWLPGQGVVDIRAARVDRAVQKYDERLRFGRNERDGQWCIFMKFPPNDGGWPELFPILGFGLGSEAPPTPDEAVAKLQRTDTRRHGEQVLERVNDHNRSIIIAREAPVKEAQEELAEAAESYFRNQGLTRYSKSYRKVAESRKQEHRYTGPKDRRKVKIEEV